MVAKTGSAFQFRDLEPNDFRTALLLMYKATLHTKDLETFYIQRVPIEPAVAQAINHRIHEIDPKIETHSVTNDTTMLLQSLTAPNRKAEATLHSRSVCLVLQNVCIEIVEQLVPFLLIPRLTSKV
jgi:hypothetical protein